MGPVLERFIAGCSGLATRNDPELIRRYQLHRLQALVQHAYLRVPYYRRLFDQHGLEPRHIQKLADLDKIPTTSRADLQAAPVDEIVARGYDASKLVVHRTGGSSGEPLSIRRTWFEDRLLQAYRLRILFRLGMRATDRRAAVVTRRLDHTPLYMRSGLLRYEEIHCLWPPDRILETLRKIQPDILRGFPSVLAWLAGCLTARDRERIRPRIVTTDSEMMTVDMRQKIGEGFRAPVIDFYDSHEFNMIAWECPSTGSYQLSEGSVIAEVLRDGQVAEPDEEGEFVGTGLHSWAMPFLRFRLGDLVTRGPSGIVNPDASSGTFSRSLLSARWQQHSSVYPGQSFSESGALGASISAHPRAQRRYCRQAGAAFRKAPYAGSCHRDRARSGRQAWSGCSPGDKDRRSDSPGG